MSALRPSSLLYIYLVSHALGIFQGMHVPIHLGTHNSLLCPQARTAGLATGSAGKQVGACTAQTSSFKHGPLFLSFPVCQAVIMILTSYIKDFAIYWRDFFSSFRNPSSKDVFGSSGMTAKKVLSGIRRGRLCLSNICPKPAVLEFCNIYLLQSRCCRWGGTPQCVQTFLSAVVQPKSIACLGYTKPCMSMKTSRFISH